MSLHETRRKTFLDNDSVRMDNAGVGVGVPAEFAAGVHPMKLTLFNAIRTVSIIWVMGVAYNVGAAPSCNCPTPPRRYVVGLINIVLIALVLFMVWGCALQPNAYQISRQQCLAGNQESCHDMAEITAADYQVQAAWVGQGGLFGHGGGGGYYAAPPMQFSRPIQNIQCCAPIPAETW